MDMIFQCKIKQMKFSNGFIFSLNGDGVYELALDVDIL